MRVAIAGAGTGIGAACARLLAQTGHRVFVCARTRSDLEALAGTASADNPIGWVAADLSTEDGAAHFARESFRVLGGLDGALVCAGAAFGPTPLLETTRAQLVGQFEGNTLAPALAMLALARAWKAHPAAGDRHLLVLSSLVTRRPPLSGTAPYTLAKAALEQLVRALAEECAPLRVNALCLQPVATRLHTQARTPADQIARYPTADEVAPSIVRLLLDGTGLTGRSIDAEALALDPPAALAGPGHLAFVEPLQASVERDELPPEAEPGRRPSPRVRLAVRASAVTLRSYPDSTHALRERLAALHAIDPGRIVLSGGGATELLERTLRALCSSGDEIVSPFPTFEVLSALCSRLGLRHRPVPGPRAADGLFLPHAARPLLAAIGPRTRLVYVATPDNPTGVSLPEDERRALCAALPASVPLVLDEAWSLELPGTLPDGPSQAPCVRLRSFSKLFGLAGLRVGYAVAPATIAGLLHRLALPYPLGAPQLAATLAALDELPRARKAALLLVRERARTATALRALGLLVSEGESPVLLVRDPARGANIGRLLFALRAARIPVQEAHWDPAALVMGLGERGQNRRLVAAIRRGLEA